MIVAMVWFCSCLEIWVPQKCLNFLLKLVLKPKLSRKLKNSHSKIEYCANDFYFIHVSLLWFINHKFDSSKRNFPSTENGEKIFVLGCVLVFCSDFRNKNNGIFVLGVGFFLQTNFDFSTSHFLQIFKISFRKFYCPELKLEKIFQL